MPLLEEVHTLKLKKERDMFAVFFAVPRLLFRGFVSCVVFRLSWCAHGVRSAWADITVYWTAATGQLYIECDQDADHVALVPDENSDRVSLYSTTDASADGLLTMDCTDVEEISIKGGDGNDTIDLGPVVPIGGFDNITRIDILGEDGGDDLYGSSYYADSIVGGQGPDSCAGHGGDDSIFGQGDGDTVVAGTGDDLVDGGVGTDSIAGEQGADSIAGGDGDDTLYHGTATLETGSDSEEDSLWGSDFGDSSSEAGDDIDRNIAVDGDWLNGVDPN